MNGIRKSSAYGQAEKEILMKRLGNSPTVDEVMAVSPAISMLESDMLEIAKFTKYLSVMYAYSCEHVKKKIRTNGKLMENSSVTKFAAEGYALAKGNIRNLYFGALIDRMINHDRDEVLENVKNFNPKTEKSIRWLAGLKLPGGAPAMAMFSACVTDEGFKFPVQGLPAVPVNKTVLAAAINEHWILKVCPLGYGTVKMIAAAALYKGGMDGIR
jgi:hypothetical protein